MGSVSMTVSRASSYCGWSSVTLNMKLVTLFLVVGMVVSQDRHMVINKRQAEQHSNDQFFLFGQILNSLGGLLGTAAEEGGQFLERQVEVNQPIVETVHNISDTIGGSEFVQGSTRTAPQLVGTKLGLAHSTAQIFSSLSCLLLCPHYPAGTQREACEQQHCTP